MVNDVLKILILNGDDNKIKVIKETIIEKTPKCVFIISNSIEDFYKKINWIGPDITIANTANDSNSMVKEAVGFLRQKSPLFPIIHLDKDITEDRGYTFQVGDCEKHIDSLSSLPKHIENLLEKTKKNRNIKQIWENHHLENKMMIFKSITLLEQSVEFDQKESIQNSLKILKENLIFYESMKR